MGEPEKEVGGLAPSKQSSPPVGAILRHSETFHRTGLARISIGSYPLHRRCAYDRGPCTTIKNKDSLASFLNEQNQAI